MLSGNRERGGMKSILNSRQNMGQQQIILVETNTTESQRENDRMHRTAFPRQLSALISVTYGQKIMFNLWGRIRIHAPFFMPSRYRLNPHIFRTLAVISPQLPTSSPRESCPIVQRHGEPKTSERWRTVRRYSTCLTVAQIFLH